MTGLVLAMALAEGPVQVLALRFVPGQRLNFEVLTNSATPAVSVQRLEGDLVLSIDAVLAPSLKTPDPLPPVDGLRIETREGGIDVHLRVPEAVPYEIWRDGGLLRLSFVLSASPPSESPSAPEAAPAVQEDLDSLYRKVFPAPAPAATEGGPPREETKPGAAGLAIGSITVRPSVTAGYVDASTALLATPQPVTDQYYEIHPSLSAEMPLSLGQADATYEATLRRGSSYALLSEVTQALGAGLQLSPGSRFQVHVREHYEHGTLETTEVDPGQEYFFRLAPFSHNEVSGGVRIDLGALTYVEAGGSVATVRLQPNSGFFNYETKGLNGVLGRELAPDLKAGVRYGFQRVETNGDRPQADATTTSLGLTLSGELTPLLTARADVAYEIQNNPSAGPGGQRLRTVGGSLDLTRQLSWGSAFTLAGGRAILPSGFESNGFYVSNFAQATMGFPSVFGCVLRGGASYRWNQYQVASVEIGTPRRDHVFGWTAGVGRPLTHWSYLRVDYRHDNRTSDLAEFETTSHTFTVQVGAGLFGGAVRP